MPTPTAAPAVSSTVGLKNMVIAPITSDNIEGTTYGTLQAVAGAIEASITPDNAEPEVQYFDDAEGDVLYPDPELTFKTKLADIPLIIQKMIFGNQIDDNGVLIRTANDKPPYFAVGFKSEKSNGKYRFIWLYKVRAKPVTETYATREGKTINRQTGEVEWCAIKRISDNRYQAIADEGENGFTAQKAAAFLESVYTPDFNFTALSALSFGSLTLSPTFSAGVTEYTATTATATNTITATAADSDATVVIKNGNTTVTSGSAATWVSGINTVTITVTNGSSSRVYTVVVTKN